MWSGQTVYDCICPYEVVESQKIHNVSVLNHVMLISKLIFIPFNLHQCSSNQDDHEFTYVIGCFQKGPTEVQFELDSEELMYADFDKDTAVFTLPDFLVLVPAKLANKTRNKLVLYSAEEVKFGAENTLVCFLNHFFPPSIKVSWTKNNQPVSEGVSLSRYYPNSDIYSCTVEHKALKSPKTRIWGDYVILLTHVMETQYLPGIKRLYTRRLMRSGIFFFLIIVLLCLMSANPVSLQIV
uniref:Ig-like domain-containing protein n=1 Tax=Salarias fasciatus TaxID=181472 RepID=A0A672GTW9_SALFA